MKRGTVADVRMAKVSEAVREICLSSNCEKKLSARVLLAITNLVSKLFVVSEGFFFYS